MGGEIDPRLGREWDELTASMGKTPKPELRTASPPVIYGPWGAGWGHYPEEMRRHPNWLL